MYKPELTSRAFFGVAFLAIITTLIACITNPPESLDRRENVPFDITFEPGMVEIEQGESFELIVDLFRDNISPLPSLVELYAEPVSIKAFVRACRCPIHTYLLTPSPSIADTTSDLITVFRFDGQNRQRVVIPFTILPNAPIGPHKIEFTATGEPSPRTDSGFYYLSFTPDYDLTISVKASLAYWEPTLGGGPAASIRALAVTPGGALLAGSSGSGAFRSVDNGDNWTAVIVLNNTFVTSFAIKGTDLFLGSGGGVYRSTNDGVIWTEKINGLGSNTEVSALAIGTNGDIFAGANEDFNNQGGVYRSTNNGDSWTWRFNGGQNTLVESLVSNSNGDIFAGTLSGLYRSTNQGQNWSLIANSPTIRSLAINPINGHMFGGRLSQSYRSTDNGMNWQAITIHPTNPHARSFAFNSSGHVFAATLGANSNDRRGVFRSTDFGITWEEINAGLPNTNAYSFTINSSRTLFVGTGNGVYRSINPVAFKPVDITRKHN